MALSKEEFKKLRERGYSTDEIIKLDKSGDLPKDKKSFGRKVADFFTGSTQRLGETIGQLGATRTRDFQEAQQSQGNLDDINLDLVRQIRENKQQGRDTSRLERQLQTNMGGRFREEEVAPALEKTGRQVVGEVVGTGIEALGFGGLASGAKSLATKSAGGFLRGALQGAKSGAIGGGSFGVAQGTADALQNDEELQDILKSSIFSGSVGALSGGAIGSILGGVSSKINRTKELNRVIKDDLTKLEVNTTKAGTLNQTTDDFIKYKLNLNNEIVKDKDFYSALRRGIDDNDLKVIKTAKNKDRDVFKKMFNLAKNASKDNLVEERPVELAGKTLMDRVRFLSGVRRETGENLSRIVKEMPKKPISINEVYETFVSDLSNIGVEVRAGGRLDFRRSRFAGQPRIQRELQSAFDDIRPNQNMEVLRTPERINAIRQRLFETLNLSKKTNEPLGSAEVALSRLRSLLKDQLTNSEKVGSVAKKYREATNKYATTERSLEDFRKLIGRDFSLEDDFSDLRAGEVGFRILGNASARPLRIIRNLENTAIDFGYKADTSVRHQFLFADFLEDLFGTQQTRSLRGQVGRGISDTESELIGTTRDIISGDKLNLLQRGYEKIRGISPEKQQEAIERILFK